MVIVGVVTPIGLTLLLVPLAMVLGILAGQLDFIPYSTASPRAHHMRNFYGIWRRR